MQRLVRALLVVASLGFTLLLCEVAARFLAWRDDQDTLERVKEIPPPARGENVSLGNLIRLSENPRIVYELRPNLDSVRFLGQPLSTNSMGFRGKPIPEKDPRSVRIVGIGDSVMFGWGVRDEQTYLSILAAKLNTKFPQNVWEVINTAVPGYNTAMEIETLKAKGLRLKPDVVIINYVNNDTNLPNFISERADYLSPDRSFLLSYLRGTLKQIDLVQAPMQSDRPKFANDPQEVPRQYRDMVGVAAVCSGLQELHSLSRQHGFDVVVLSSRTLPAWVRRLSLRLKFDVLEVGPAWEHHAAEQNIPDPRAVFSLGAHDPHPSVEGHKFMADMLFRLFKKVDRRRHLAIASPGEGARR